MERSIHKRTALVTGGGRGLGKAIAVELAKSGADVILLGRDEKTLSETKIEIQELGVRVFSFGIDVTDAKKVKEVFSEIAKEPGNLDIVVNNVGGAEPFGGFESLRDEDWQSAFEINFLSAVWVSREALPLLRKSKAARLINISSVPAHQPGFFNPHYSAAKAALLNLSKHLANVLARDQILVNTICPSTLKGGGWEKNIKDRATRDRTSVEEASASMEREESAKSPLGRIGTPEDVAALVTFLVSDQANFITGHCFNVDGGITRSIL